MIPFSGPLKLQYAPDVGEAFVRAAEVDQPGASVHHLDGPVATVEEIVELIDHPGIDVTKHRLAFPADVDDSSFTALVDGPVSRPLAAGVADALERFRALLDAGLVHAPTGAPA